MKIFFTILVVLFRLFRCATFAAVFVVSGIATKILADAGSFWVLVSIAVCLMSFISGIEALIGGEDSRA